MTTTRPSNRRGQPPHALSLNTPRLSSSKPSVSLEEWESKAPLGDLENASVLAVKAALDRPSLPFKVRLSRHSSLLAPPHLTIYGTTSSSKSKKLAPEHPRLSDPLDLDLHLVPQHPVSHRPQLLSLPPLASPVFPPPHPRPLIHTSTSTPQRQYKHPNNSTTGSRSSIGRSLTAKNRILENI